MQAVVVAGDVFDDNAVGHDFIKLGDAVLATDPLSASGVQRAMQGALAAAVTVNTILRRPDSARLAEDFYRERQTDIAQQHRVAMRRAYGEVARFADRPFWDQRGHLTPTPVPTPLPEPAPAALLRRSDAVEIIVSASLVGDFVEAHPALRHPHLPGPIAFVGDRPIVPLLLTLPRLACYGDMTERLAQLIGPQSGSAILQWLLRRRILETVHDIRSAVSEMTA